MLTVHMPFILVLLSLVLQVTVSSAEKLIVCYFPNWSVEKNHQTAILTIDNIDPSLCTHMLYAFAGIDDVTLTLKPGSERDETTDDLYSQFAQLKQRSPQIKLMLSVGGATVVNNNQFATIVRSTNTQVAFARDVIKYLRKRHFDGIDIDWEYPTRETKKQFTEFLATLRREFEYESARTNTPRLQLSAAVGVGKTRIDTSYEVANISRVLDFISLMAYDYHSARQGLTGFNSPLLSRTAINPRFNSDNCQKSSVDDWLEAGAPANKLVLGMAAWGSSFTLSSSSQHSVGDSVSGEGKKGPFTQMNGRLAYYEVCDQKTRSGISSNWDTIQQVPYIFWEDQWVGYDNPASIAKKAEYVNDVGLAGAMLWSLDLDDFAGTHCSEGTYPLTRKIQEILNSKSTPSTQANPTVNPDQTRSQNIPDDLGPQTSSETNINRPNVVVVTSSRASTLNRVYATIIIFFFTFTVLTA